ncbi:MAG: hypothetical protein ACLUKN_06780 [Bacilli bacterium]
MGNEKSYKDLQEFIGALDAAGELKRISVSPDRDIKNNRRRIKSWRRESPLFENVIDNGKVIP